MRLRRVRPLTTFWSRSCWRPPATVCAFQTQKVTQQGVPSRPTRVDSSPAIIAAAVHRAGHSKGGGLEFMGTHRQQGGMDGHKDGPSAAASQHLLAA
jgi:hypothetical protein